MGFEKGYKLPPHRAPVYTNAELIVMRLIVRGSGMSFGYDPSKIDPPHEPSKHRAVLLRCIARELNRAEAVEALKLDEEEAQTLFEYEGIAFPV